MSACPSTRTAPVRARREEPRWPRSARGVSRLSLLLLLLLAGGAYLAWVWVPVYIVHYEVKQIVRDYMNQAVKLQNDASLVERMIGRIARLHSVIGEDAAGRRTERPLIVIDPRDVSWERDTTTTPPVLRVSVVYERDIIYPWIDRTTTKAFAVDLENELTVPVWGSER
jgi:hypothetical protein